MNAVQLTASNIHLVVMIFDRFDVTLPIRRPGGEIRTGAACSLP
jgi:hypothetical protein